MARGERESGAPLDEWLSFATQGAERRRRRSSGLTGVLAKNAGRVRTVRRIYRDLGFWTATSLILRELRGPRR